jgi:hypothetical protein
MSSHPPRALACLLTFCGIACSDVEENQAVKGHSHGLVTRLGLTFTPGDGGEPVYVEWADPELDGDPRIDALVLEDGSTDPPHSPRAFDVQLDVWNDLEDPPQEVTPEIEGLGTEHWFFFTGSGIWSTATGDNPDAVLAWDYADEDDDGLPIGLNNQVETLALGTGELVVTLRHLVPEDGQPTKVAGLDTLVAEDGFSAIPGGNDVQVVFPVEVR